MASSITVSALQATAGFGQNFLSWNYSNPGAGLTGMHLDAVEIWAATVDDRTVASKFDERRASQFVHVFDDGAQRWYWARARNLFGEFGAWYPSGGGHGRRYRVDRTERLHQTCQRPYRAMGPRCTHGRRRIDDDHIPDCVSESVLQHRRERARVAKHEYIPFNRGGNLRYVNGAFERQPNGDAGRCHGAKHDGVMARDRFLAIGGSRA